MTGKGPRKAVDGGHAPARFQIRHWVKAAVPLAKADGGGLTFTLSAGGSAGWILRYSFGGRHREPTIGRYPDIGFAEARGARPAIRVAIFTGLGLARHLMRHRWVSVNTTLTGPLP